MDNIKSDLKAVLDLDQEERVQEAEVLESAQG
jgi:hypothetical protein